ncbi:MAG: glycosyltransferase family 39 protein [Planctomycetaceae bacterium]|nr:glycosyltransferase family 39 protein [Planctomycetaceae bacterium]
MRSFMGPTRIVLLVMSIAFVLRLIAAVEVDVRARRAGEICLIPGDADGYWELAGRIAEGQTYSLYEPPRYVLRMPGFPAVLAVPRLLFGEATLPARVWLALLGSACCGMAYLLGRELASEAIGLMSASITAIVPAFVGFSGLFLSETVFALTILVSLWTLARLWPRGDAKGDRFPPDDFPARQPTVWQAVLAGVAVTAATMIRPTWLLVGPFAAVVLIATGPSRRHQWILAGVLLLAQSITLFPWALRNQVVTGHWVPTTLWMGPSLYDGLHEGATGDSDMRFFDEENLLGQMSEYDMNREYARRAWDYLGQNPVHGLQLALVKQLRFWSPVPNAPQFGGWLFAFVLIVGTLPLYGLVVAGIVRHRGNVRLLAFTLGPVLYFAALHLLFVGSIRYRLPAEYPLWVLASAGAASSSLFAPRSS